MGALFGLAPAVAMHETRILVRSGLIIDKDLGNMVKVDRFGCAHL